MSFNGHARKVRRLDFSSVQRRNAFGNCVESYSYFCRASFSSIYARLADEFGFDSDAPDASERLLRALDALEIEREQKLKRLRVFEQWRIRQKRAGRREVSHSEQRWLAAIRRGDEPAPAEVRLTRWMQENTAHQKPTHPLVSGASGCLFGCLIGAIVCPVLFVLTLLALGWMAPSSDPDAAEGVVFGMILASFAGAVFGAVLFPIGRELVAMIRD